MFLITLPSGKKFSANEGQSLNDAAVQNGITIPHSCRTGRCGACKCKISGPTKLLFDELSLNDLEKKDGWMLSCARSAVADINLEIEDFGDIKLSPPKIIPAKIQSLELKSKDVLKVILRLPPNKKFDFIEGQYIDLIGPNGISRSYSLAQNSYEDMLELHVRYLENGFMSNYLFNNAKIGDLLRVNGPRGTFFLRKTFQTHIVFLATGTGIAPIKAMLESIEKIPNELKPKSVTLFWGGRYVSDLYWNPKEALKSIKYIPVISRPTSEWIGEVGYVQDVMIKHYDEIKDLDVYACGSNNMIKSAQSKFKKSELNIKFFSDAFVVSG